MVSQILKFVDNSGTVDNNTMRLNLNIIIPVVAIFNLGLENYSGIIRANVKVGLELRGVSKSQENLSAVNKNVGIMSAVKRG